MKNNISMATKQRWMSRSYQRNNENNKFPRV